MSAAFALRRRRRKLKAEINVVPYIDVMLVLLIIFMVTAPLLNLGVDVNLPESDAKAVDQQKKPLTVTIDKAGNYSLVMPDMTRKSVDGDQLTAEVQALARADAGLSVIIAGDGAASYQQVFAAMTRVQKAGVQKMALVSKPTEAH
jgi:biopolymer transport protein TolR